MDTKLIDGVQPLAIDRKVLSAAKKQAGNPFHGVDVHIAILNEQGQLYRVVTLYQPIEAMRFVESCTALGLIDRVGFSDTHLKTADSLTGEVIRTRYAAILQLGTEPHPLPR